MIINGSRMMIQGASGAWRHPGPDEYDEHVNSKLQEMKATRTQNNLEHPSGEKWYQPASEIAGPSWTII